MIKKTKKTKAPATTVKPVHDLLKVNHAVLAFTCAVLAFILYANTINHSYTIDDDQVIKSNKLTKAGISSLPVIFKSAYRAGYWNKFEGVYRPLSVAMYAIEWQIAPNQPWLSHLINVLLYVLTAWLLYNLMRNLLHKHHPLVPLMITLLYIVLPVHTEVVASIKSRDEILCFLFAVISIQQLYNWLTSKKIISLAFSLLAFFLALLSKESAITLLAIFPLVVYFFIGTNRKQILMVALSFLSVGIVFLAIRYAVIGSIAGKTVIPLLNNSLVATDDHLLRFGTAIYIMGKYLWLLVLPITLVYDYSYNAIPLINIASPQAFIPLLIFILLIVYAVKNFKKRNVVSFGILFFIITISIVSNILMLIESTMAERFLYMPSLGYCIAIGLVLSSLIKTKIKSSDSLLRQIIISPVLLFFFIAIVIYSVRTVARNSDWKNNLTLLTVDVKSSPNSARVLHAYAGTVLFEQALVEKDHNKRNEYEATVVKTLEKATSILDNDAGQWYHLGIAYRELGDINNAIRAYRKSQSFAEPGVIEGFLAAGFADGLEKHYDSAINNFIKVLQIDSLSIDAWNNIGNNYRDAGKIKESIDAFNRLIAIKPDYAMAYYNLGNTYAKAGDYRVAQDNYHHALQLNPAYVEALDNIGNCYIALQMRDSARVYYEKAVATDPNDISSLLNMGVFLRQSGDTVNSEIWFSKARGLGAKI